MVNPYTLTMEDIKRIADERSALHKGHPTQRKLSKDYDFIGLMGEWEFARRTGLPLDLRVRPSGDEHKDFTTSIGDVDVKTYRKAYNLPREEGKPHADILVLAQFKESMKRAKLLGWEWDEAMVEMPVSVFKGHRIPNHLKRREDLQDIDVLLERIKDDRIYMDPVALAQLGFGLEAGRCPNCYTAAPVVEVCIHCWWEPGEPCFRPYWMSLLAWQQRVKER